MANSNNENNIRPLRCRPIITLAVVLVVVGCQLTTATKYSVCDQAKSLADVKNVVVSDCEKLDDTCPFVRGFNKTIELDFVPKQKIDVVKVKVAGKLSQLPVPFHVSPDLACGNYGFECPLEAGTPYKFKISMPILRTYPKINVDVFVRLVDDKGDVIGCAELPARIQEPAKESIISS